MIEYQLDVLRALGYFGLCAYLPVVAFLGVWFYKRRKKFPIRGRYPLLVVFWCCTYILVSNALCLIEFVAN